MTGGGNWPLKKGLKLYGIAFSKANISFLAICNFYRYCLIWPIFVHLLGKDYTHLFLLYKVFPTLIIWTPTMKNGFDIYMKMHQK